MKYIIDLPTEFSFVAAFGSGSDGMPITKEVYNWTNMEPYTEPDRKAIEDEVWEFALKLMEDVEEPHFRSAEMVDCFCKESARNVMMDGYQEVKSKYEAWKKQKDEIRVGNEVEYVCCDETVRFVVTGINNNGRAYGFKYPCEYDDPGEYCDLDLLRKTGRHFPQVEELLKAMKGEE